MSPDLARLSLVMASSPSPSTGGDPNACNGSSSNNDPPSEGGLSNLINEYPLLSFPTTTAIGSWTESSVAAGPSLGAAALQHHTANHARVLRETLATQGEGPSALQLLKLQNIDRLREAWPAVRQYPDAHAPRLPLSERVVTSLWSLTKRVIQGLADSASKTDALDALWEDKEEVHKCGVIMKAMRLCRASRLNNAVSAETLRLHKSLEEPPAAPNPSLALAPAPAAPQAKNKQKTDEVWLPAEQQQQPSQSQVREKPDDSRRARTPMRPSPKLRYVLWTSASSSPQAPFSPLPILCQFSRIYPPLPLLACLLPFRLARPLLRGGEEEEEDWQYFEEADTSKLTPDRKKSKKSKATMGKKQAKQSVPAVRSKAQKAEEEMLAVIKQQLPTSVDQLSEARIRDAHRASSAKRSAKVRQSHEAILARFGI
ncbi:hypothetical protein K4K49_004229 [Colletotrichum sp. SAR 10_70]|nr:hypothetical protein K4K50_011436 [Colletotrichum sp. SAR 10_71]KAI8171453.1 hypothetical protein K4K49_004229 [Colletotrichum sp. SAR 10_70]KAJ4996810.1 hypothetical protein K4K48_007818 [Colletotrichum sp. SAR 10_66]